jgi:hypothetical protein
MKYRSKQYSVVLSIGGKWNWSVDIDGHTKSGSAPNRPAASSWPKPKLIGHWPPRRSDWCDRRADQHITFGPILML